MTHANLTPILADIAATMDRVRELDIEGHARAAALQCLADARAHLEAAGEYRITVRLPTNASVMTSTTSDYAFREGDSVPPPATDNQAVRNKATEAFRESRRILREVIK
jgi:hypothetical protein